MGSEPRKCCEKRRARGDFEKYLIGRGFDIGCVDDPLQTPRPTSVGLGSGQCPGTSRRR